MKEKIIKYIREILEEQEKNIEIEISEESNLRDLGLTSFDLATLTVMIEEEYDVDIFEEGIVLTVGEILSVLKENV